MPKPRLDYKYSVDKSAGKRVTSGALSQLSPDQVREFKEAFALIDKNGTGTIQAADVKDLLFSLGQEASDAEAEEILSQMPQPLTFSLFLSTMSAKMVNMASHADLTAAFNAFSDSEGVVYLDDIKKALIESGMPEDQIDSALKGFIKTSFTGDTLKHKELVNALTGTS